MATRKRKATRNQKTTRVPRSALDRHKRQIQVRLSQIRGNRSQRSFARELGVFQQNVNRYENGTTPHADFLITLALQEKVSLDWLLLGRGRPRRR
jgi:transcriptional regulator with XRE-family HTH domain